MCNGFDLLGADHTTRLDPEFKARIDHMVSLAEKNNVTEAEKMHVKAVKLFADG